MGRFSCSVSLIFIDSFRSLEKEQETYEKKFGEFLECFNMIAKD